MKMLKLTLLVLLMTVTFDIANAASMWHPDRRDRERRRHERWERRHNRDHFRRDHGPRDRYYRDYGRNRY